MDRDTLRFTPTAPPTEGSIDFTGHGSCPLRGTLRDGRTEFVVDTPSGKLRQTHTGIVSELELKLSFSGITRPTAS